jgi:signal transduction histidine kinase
MYQIWQAIMSSDGFMPHAHCYLYNKWLILLNFATDLIIGISYVAISLTLVEIVRRVRLPFHWIFLAFGAFIAACGGTSFMEVVTLYTPCYWISTFVKGVTAVASVATAVVLPMLVPHVQRLFEAARRSQVHQRQLEIVNADLAAMNDRMREVDQLKTRFFENISHELRTPLSLIISPLSRLVHSSALDLEIRGELQICERNARVMLKHVNDILDLSRVDGAAMAMSSGPVDFGRLVDRTVDYFRSGASLRRVHLAVDAASPTLVMGDADMLERVTVNLLSNALKFVPEGGRVACRVLEDGDRVVLEVEDSGPGVPEEARDTIFERFRQADEGHRRRHGGTGLGLSIVCEFVNLHGGAIEVRRGEKLGGALFRVTLPRAPEGTSAPLAEFDEAYARHARAEVESLAQPMPEALGGGTDLPLVLVVEDNPELVRVLYDALGAEFRVAVAGDGAQAFERALSLRPDGIVTDLMMAGLSGEDLLVRLQDHPDTRDIPVLVCTALAEQRVRVRLLERGAHDYVVKPFAPEEVRARVRNMVASHLATARLQRSLRELREAHDHRNRFTATMSHELRTPLNSIIGFSEILLAAEGSESVESHRRSIAFIHSAGTELLRHINDLLDLSRLETGHVDLHLREIDVDAEILGAVETVRPIAERAGIALGIPSSSGGMGLTADPKRFRQILYNLLSNAIKFTPRGGRVTVDVGHGEGGIEIAVVDTGIGVAAEDRERIFEPYEQVESRAGQGPEGTGLGLAITRQLVLAHGWSIRVDSRPGGGSRFTVVIQGLATAPRSPLPGDGAGDSSELAGDSGPK